MQDEILSPVLSSDSVAVPRYDMVDSTGTVLQTNVELRLKNPVYQEGTPYDKESVLPDSLCTNLGIATTSKPFHAFKALLNKIEQIISTYRTAAAQDVIDRSIKSRVETVEGKLGGSGSVKFSNLETDSLKTTGEVEIYSNQPHIDFHHNNSSDDYTTRIIETNAGQLNFMAPNGVLINGKKTDTDPVTLEVASGRLTDFAYTAKYSELLGAVFVRIYGTINTDMSTGYDYNILNIRNRLPNSNAALAVKCNKNAMAFATSGGFISIRPLEAGINGYDVYITGFWFVG